MRSEDRSDTDVLQALERILSSPGFARNLRMSQFLRFLVERHLGGRDDELKESVVAIEVFGRRPDYDPRIDSIVRTEAARLRARLTEYYAGAGTADAVIIELPKGRYVPRIRRRPSSPPAARRAMAARWGMGVVGIGLVAVIAWGLVAVRREPISIAVLPFVNLSPSGEQEYFVDGLTDEIISTLSVIEGLDVRSRTSSFAMKGRTRNVREAGGELGADYLVEGSVTRDGDRLRVLVQLVRVRDDSSVWSGRFDTQMSDIVSIQEEIATGVVNNLRLRLGRGRRRYETSVAAYTHYLNGRAKALKGSLERFECIEEFEAAIEKDPSFAPAYAGLASAYASRTSQFPLNSRPDELAKMRTAAEKAVDLDPLLAEAHEALGLAYAREADWEESERAFRTALDLEPRRSQALTAFAFWHLQVLGRSDEALQLLQRAVKADPLAADVRLGLAWVLISLNRADEAAEHCRRVPDGHDLKAQCEARVMLGQRKYEDAVALLARDPKLPANPQTRGLLGYALARVGRRAEAEQMASAATFPNEQALIYAGLADPDRAFDALTRTKVVGLQRLGQYLSFPEFDGLRQDPRMDALRRGIAQPH